MRTSSIVILLALLLVAGLWVGSQFRAISTLERENALLQERLGAGIGPAVGSRERTTWANSTGDKKLARWNRIALDIEGAYRFPYKTLGLDAEFRSMSREELTAALDEVEAANLPAGHADRLKLYFIVLLSEMDPGYVLKRLIPRLHEDGRLAYPLQHAMETWTMRDPEGACAWLDEQIAAKTIRGKRIEFEMAAISSLLLMDPDAAGRRLTALPENQRSQIVYGDDLGRGWDMSKQTNTDFAVEFATLARHLQEQDHLGVLATVVSNLGENYRTSAIQKIQDSLAGMKEAQPGIMPFATLKDFLVRIEATPAERDACILEVVKRGAFERLPGNGWNTTSDDVDALRDWVAKESPGLVDQATATVLEDRIMSDKNHHPEWADYALQCHELSGDDTLLLPFLNGSALRNQRKLARSIAAELSDKKLSEEYLRVLK